MPNFVKRFLRYHDFSIYKMAAVRHLGFLNFKFWLPVRLGGLICIVIPNFIKVGRTAADISHLTFLKLIFCTFLRVYRDNVGRIFIEIGQTVAKI